MHTEDFAAAIGFVRDDPDIVWVIGWLSIHCGGGWGMPMWKHFGYLLQNKPSPGYAARHETKLFAREMAKAVARNGEDPVKHEHGVLLMYALAADWPDVARQCIDAGLDHSMKAEMTTVELEKMSHEMKDVWDRWTETRAPAAPTDSRSRECCICFENPNDAVFWPCAHNDFCFGCTKDLANCPICRSSGRSNPIKRQTT